MYRLNYRASSNLMQWTYASLRSFTPYCPRLPTPSVLLNTHRYYPYNLGWRRL